MRMTVQLYGYRPPPLQKNGTGPVSLHLWAKFSDKPYNIETMTCTLPKSSGSGQIRTGSRSEFLRKLLLKFGSGSGNPDIYLFIFFIAEIYIQKNKLIMIILSTS